MLSVADAALLDEVLSKHRPDLLSLLRSRQLVDLSDDQREELRDIVAHEMLTTGLQGPTGDAELSPRGVALDSLIGALRRGIA